MSAKNKTYSFFYRILLLGIIGSFLLNSSASLLYVSSASSNRIIKFLDFSDEPENEKEVKQIVIDSMKFANESPWPDPVELEEGVYADH